MNLPCKKFDGKIKKVYNMHVHKKKIYPRETLIYTIAVTLAVRSHLFSYRTQKLSSLAPKILCWRRHGKIGCCCIQTKNTNQTVGVFLLQQRSIPVGTGKKSQFVSYLIYVNNSFRPLLLTVYNLLRHSLTAEWLLFHCSKKTTNFRGFSFLILSI